MLVVIAEILLFISGVATGIFFRNQISAYIKSALSWGKKKADEVEKNL